MSLGESGLKKERHCREVKSMEESDIADRWSILLNQVNEQLEQCLSDAALSEEFGQTGLSRLEDGTPETLAKAMRYGVFPGGKRLRPLLLSRSPRRSRPPRHPLTNRRQPRLPLLLRSLPER